MTRILVTGSQGFVGRHLRAALDARGIACVGVDRPGTGAEFERDLSAPDLDVDDLVARAGAIDHVIYMAATITRGSSVDALARDNLRAIADAPVRLMEAFAARASAPHLVYCSTYKSYGPARTLPIDPMRPPQDPDPHSYGSAKSLAEALLAISSRRAGYRYAIVRPTCIYGPGQHLHNAIPLFLKAAWEGRVPTVAGDGQNLRDDVYAPDLAWAMIEATLARAEGAFHAGGERGRTIFETAQVCAEAVAALGGPRVTPAVDASKPAKWWLDQSFDLTRTRAQLSYDPLPLLEGLKTEALWIKAGGIAADAVRFATPRAPRVRG
mgnify:CR=1 FL=1